jgi:GAF domain-containing protein
MPVFGAGGRRQLSAVLELRNANAPRPGADGDFASDVEELLDAVTHQTGVSFDNVLYNNRLSQALQKFEYSQFDMELLQSQIVESGKNLFQASVVMLGRRVGDGVIQLVFSGDHANKTVPEGAGATFNVLETRVPIGLAALSKGNGSTLRAEYGFDEDEDPSIALHPVIEDKGGTMGVVGIFGCDEDDESDQLTKMFCAKVASLLRNCELYTNAMSQNAKVQNKLELLDVSKAFASELDQHTLMMTIIEKTRTVLDADRCALFMVDEVRDQMWAALQDGTIIRTGKNEGIVGWVATNDQTLNIPDAYSDARFNTDVDKRTGYHTHSILAVAVHNREGKLTGVIQMINKRGGAFQEEDREMLEMIASQAGVTLNNAQIFDAVKKDQQNFEVLMDISKKLSSELNLKRLVLNIMSSARDLLRCDRSTLFLADHAKKELFSYIATGMGDQELRLPITTGIAGNVASSNKTINIPDAYEDSRFSQEFDRKSGYRTRSILCVPVNNSKGKLIGVAQMINKEDGEGVFDVSDENLLTAFTSQAAVSIENAQLFEKALESKNSMESVLASITNLVIAFDKQGCLKMCNHSSWLEKYFGLSQENIGTKLTYSKWLNDFPELVEQIGNTMKTDVGFECVEPLDVVQGTEEYSVNFTISPLTKPADQAEGSGTGTGGDTDGGCVVVFEDLSEKKKMKGTLGRYLSGALVDQVLGSGADVLGGVRQKVTILFSDIRSFTTISEVRLCYSRRTPAGCELTAKWQGMDAVDLVAMLNDYFTYELNPIFDNGGASRCAVKRYFNIPEVMK